MNKTTIRDIAEPTIDKLRVQEAILKHSVTQAIKKFYQETGMMPDINIRGNFDSKKVILIEPQKTKP